MIKKTNGSSGTSRPVAALRNIKRPPIGTGSIVVIIKMLTDRFFWYLLIGCGGGILAFFKGFTLRKEKKLIEDIPTSKARSLAMGLVEVEGKAAICNKLLESPFAKAKCVYYCYKVEEERGSGNNHRWLTIAKGESPACFYVEDETGKALVNPFGADFHLTIDRKYKMHSISDADDEFLFIDGLERLGINWRTFLGDEKKLRGEETYIQPGDHIYILGTAMTTYASPEDGGAAGHVIIRKDSSYFCISDLSQRELLNSFSWRIYLYLWGGPALTVICLFLLAMVYFK